MNWLKRIRSVLDKEPETWLAYLHGQHYEKLTHLSGGKKKYTGFFSRFSIWLYLLLTQTRLKFKPLNKKVKFLVYAETTNQKNTLEQTILSLKRNKQSVLAVAPKKILNKSDVKDQIFTIKIYGFWEVFKSFIVLILRCNVLRRQLKGKPKKLIKNDLNVFLNVYDELVYFEKLLKETKPEYVIVSNDHNAANRVLLALARELSIKTAYMQHASVSKLFPAINVDYAFLDGESALNVYRECECNVLDEKNRLNDRQVFLSGQKKKVGKAKTIEKDRVGIALNALDSFKDIVQLIDYLIQSGSVLKVRWHPGLSKRVVSELINSLKEYKVELSNPQNEPLERFFSDIKYLVSGNSSIHLEAALAGIPSIYYEASKSNFDDYYGYVRNKLAFQAETMDQVVILINKLRKKEIKINGNSVQFYSSTYGTEWESREGELTAQVLISLAENKPLPIKPYFI